MASLVRAADLDVVVPSDVTVPLPEAVAEELSSLQERARQAELSLDLPAALDARRQIVQRLEGTLEAAVAPGRLAQALSRVAATEVEAGDTDEAVRVWRRALALDTSLALDATYSPSAREAFDEARSRGATLPPRPSEETLEALCEAARLDAVLWIATGQDAEGDALVRLLHVRGSPVSGEVRHGLPEVDDERTLVLEAISTRLSRELAALSAEPDDGDPPPPPPPTPWYRRWWVWTLVGVAAAGAATATGLVFGLGDERVEVIVDIPRPDE